MHRRHVVEVVREPAGQIILASRSPRRAELLTAAGISFDVLAADIDETPRVNEPPDAYVERLAIEKARAVLALRPAARDIPIASRNDAHALAMRPVFS